MALTSLPEQRHCELVAGGLGDAGSTVFVTPVRDPA